MRLGIDIMGGDFAPKKTIEGALLARQILHEDIRIVLFGNESSIQEEFKNNKACVDGFEIVHSPEVITMSDHPTKAFSQKPNSSISSGFRYLKEGKIDAFAGSGNTGAMLVGSIYSVKAITGVIRPCITSILPKQNGSVGIILDVGTNADCKPDVLYQFAILGSVYARQVHNIENPKVALLNIGEEQEKGNLLTQAAHNLMKDSRDFNFIGNVEGRDLFNEKADVIICDGFTGNVVLKQAEAFYRLIKLRGISDDYFDRFNYEIYGGTPILGINSTVVIGHGISNEIAIKNMIIHTRDVVRAGLSNRIKEAFDV